VPLLKPPERPEPTTYLVDGRHLPRVSSILAVVAKPGIVAWKLRAGADKAAEISKTATDWGKRLHAALEAVNREQGFYSLMTVDGDLMEHVDAYGAWYEANVSRVVAAEKRVASLGHGFAGTLDCLVEMKDGRLAVLDFKSSKHNPRYGLDVQYGWQLAAYRLALAEQERLIAQRRIVLQLPSNEPGRLIVHEMPNHRADTEAFLACLTIFKALTAAPAARGGEA
jgi:hypothetical protein